MTKEEAIRLLSLLPMTVVDADFDGATVEAIKLAIEALQLNPDAARESIDEVIKTAQQERPKGRWKHGNCTECGLYVGETTCRHYSYCPNCGVEMER